jgi:hypothetical protein
MPLKTTSTTCALLASVRDVFFPLCAPFEWSIPASAEAHKCTSLKSTHLFTSSIKLQTADRDGRYACMGRRRIFTVKPGGESSETGFAATVLPTIGSDLLLVRADGSSQAMTSVMRLKADDGEFGADDLIRQAFTLPTMVDTPGIARGVANVSGARLLPAKRRRSSETPSAEVSPGSTRSWRWALGERRGQGCRVRGVMRFCRRASSVERPQTTSDTPAARTCGRFDSGSLHPRACYPCRRSFLTGFLSIGTPNPRAWRCPAVCADYEAIATIADDVERCDHIRARKASDPTRRGDASLA